MRKLTALTAALITAVSLAGCNTAAGPDRPVSDYIGSSATEADITHHISGSSVQWTAEGRELDGLRAWASELEYRPFKHEEGRSPGDSDGGEVYDFIPPEGDGPGFSYVINGPEECYLLIEGSWYSVSNPSRPPVTEPQKE